MTPKLSKKINIGPFKFNHQIESLMFGFAGEVFEATKLLERCKAWPDTGITFDLLIEAGVRCEVRRGSHAKGLGVEAESFVPSLHQLAIGESFLSTPALLDLLKSSSKQALLVHSLGHETFHMTEVDRQKACKVPYRSSPSGFARSIRPEMSSTWIELCSMCAAHYVGHIRSQPENLEDRNSFIPAFSREALEAVDVVSEGVADLIGLKVVEAAFGSYQELDAQLPKVRIEYGRDAKEYQSGAFLDAFLASSAPLTLENIVRRSWEHAAGKLLSDPSCPNHIKSKIQTVSFTFDSPLADLDLAPLTPMSSLPPHRTNRKACL